MFSNKPNINRKLNTLKSDINISFTQMSVGLFLMVAGVGINMMSKESSTIQSIAVISYLVGISSFLGSVYKLRGYNHQFDTIMHGELQRLGNHANFISWYRAGQVDADVNLQLQNAPQAAPPMHRIGRR